MIRQGLAVFPIWLSKPCSTPAYRVGVSMEYTTSNPKIMKSIPITLFLPLFLFSCSNEEQQLRYQHLQTNIIGEWYLVDIPAAEESWAFHEDGTYAVRMGQTEDRGTWELEKDILVLDGDTKNQEIIIIENNQLNWGNYHFKKAGNAFGSINTTQLAKDLLGAWELDSEDKSSTYEFFQDGTYELLIGDQANAISYNGKWEIDGNNLVLDKQRKSARSISINDNTLIWRSSSYSRLQRTPLKDDFLADRLLGQWYSDEIGYGITYTFQDNGQFKSFDGRYTSEGQWEIKGTDLIIDNYEAAATPIRINEEQLKWDGTNFLKIDKQVLPAWRFDKLDKQIHAAHNGKTKVIATDKSTSEASLYHKISTQVGPYVAIQVQEQPTGQVAQNYYQVYNAASMKKVKLTQLFSEGELFDAFRQNKLVKSATKDADITDLEDLLLSIPPDCNLLLADHLLSSFTFYQLHSNTIEIRIAIPSNCTDQNKPKNHFINLRLPIPTTLSKALKTADKSDHLVKS